MEKNEKRGVEPSEERRRLLERFKREGWKIKTSNSKDTTRSWIEIKPSRK